MTEPLDEMIGEHVAEASFVWLQRCYAVQAPDCSLQQLADLDERLDAHIDGLRVAGDAGWAQATVALDIDTAEDFFPASVLALEAADDRFDDIVRRMEDAPGVVKGVISALGWVEPSCLSGRVMSLLADPSPSRQLLGVAACGLHRKDPGPALDPLLASPAAPVRARAVRTAGELGRTDLLPQVLEALADTKRDVRFWAAWSAVLLGDRGKALGELAECALRPGLRQLAAFRLALQAMSLEKGHELLKRLEAVGEAQRLRIAGAGIVGVARYLPWLVDQMANPTLARVAGEAFVNVTGADFNQEGLEVPPPQDFQEGPTEDPADEDVAVPEDIGLPWPDKAKIEKWWGENGARFEPGTRYFMGAPVTREHCAGVLKNGCQRQRILAAHYLCLIEPGTALFNTSARVRHQQRRLERLGQT
jgi:uncharacterized protein (TIGR02270 family)